MSKWRRYLARARVEVYKDQLAEAGVWPWPVAKQKFDLRTEQQKRDEQMSKIEREIVRALMDVMFGPSASTMPVNPSGLSNILDETLAR